MHYPKFTPKSTSPDGCLIYSWESLRRELDECPAGAQALFIRNNACANVKSHYGLKLYTHRWDAVCSYERQKLAARYFCAPPVGKIVQVRDKNNKIRYWGYQTCVAIAVDRDSPWYYQLFPTEHSEWKGPERLRRLLRGISLQGLPANDLKDKDVHCPTPIRGRKKYYLGGDLHTNNVMIWSDEHGERPVCIDFGFHCVLSSNRGPICPVYARSIY